ncbi:MAG: pseudouridine synthase [Gammaproteobacteria bacterium]
MKQQVVTEKLQKVLARAGYGSRRELERWIAAGRVKVNGKRATIGTRVAPGDAIHVDGKRLGRQALGRQSVRVLRYHKTAGEICSRRADTDRPTVFDNLPRIKSGRWIAVGRLDLNSSGLLLMTNDGGLANRLMHPSSALVREYAVRVRGQVTAQTIRALRHGVQLEDGSAKFETIVHKGGEGANHWYHVTLREGRNREVRRLWASQGTQVSRLTRVQFGPVSLPRSLPRGRWDELSDRQVATLMKAATK